MHGVGNQDSCVKKGVNGRFSVCLLVRVITVCMYGSFVNGVCMYSVAVLEALWRPTVIYWN